MVKSPWFLSSKFDPRALVLADRHYSREKPGTSQFLPPGRGLVLLTREGGAVWATSWQRPEFAKHRWPGAWLCTIFRNESRRYLSSDLVRAAVACTLAVYGEPPAFGMVTFVDCASVRPKANPGRCFLAAGFEVDGVTSERGYLALRLAPERMPEANPPRGWQLGLGL